MPRRHLQVFCYRPGFTEQYQRAAAAEYHYNHNDALDYDHLNPELFNRVDLQPATAIQRERVRNNGDVESCERERPAARLAYPVAGWTPQWYSRSERFGLVQLRGPGNRRCNHSAPSTHPQFLGDLQCERESLFGERRRSSFGSDGQLRQESYRDYR